jgi:hypothetical protein
MSFVIMEQFLFLFIHIGLPLVLLLVLLWNRPRSKIGLLGSTLCIIALALFLFLWGQWPIAASIYLKYAVLLIMALAIFKCIRNYRKTAPLFPKGLLKNLTNTVLLVLAVGCGFLVYKLIEGRNYPQEEVRLQFPLKGGSYYISSGGSNKVINNHFGTPVASQQYALDINKLGGTGRVSRVFGNKGNADHYIFGELVYAPCSGSIIALKTDVKDNDGPGMDVSAEDGQGNFITIDCDGNIISLVHLKANSIGVKQYQKVTTGELLGQIGNSGFSQEPHLHLQAARTDREGHLTGIPINFNGRKPVRNAIVRN